MRAHSWDPLRPLVNGDVHNGYGVIDERSFKSSIEAALVLIAIRRRHPERAEAGIHPCPTCSAFHLTSDRRSARNRWTREALQRLG